MEIDIVKLKDIADVYAGGTPKRSENENWKNGDIPWVKISDIKDDIVNSTDEFITKKGLENSSAKLFPRGTIIFTIFATIGECSVLNIEASTNQAIAGIIVKTDRILPKYLLYYLKSIKNDLIHNSRGVAQKNINLSILRNINIPIIPIESQEKNIKKIELSLKLIDKRNQQITALSNLKQSIFYDMFGDPEDYSNKTERIKIKDLFKVETGSTPSRKEAAYWKAGNVPWVKTTQLKDTLISEADEFITEKAVKETNIKLFPENTILIAMYGQGKTRGRTGMLNFPAATNQACAALLPRNEINVIFIWQQLKLRYEALRNLGRGGNQPNLNLSLIKEFDIIFPRNKQQNQYSKIVKKIEQQEEQVLKSQEKLLNLYDSLMQKAFKGELFQE